MRKSMKLWSKRIYESLKAKLEEGASISMPEQNFKPSLFVQVIRELVELTLKHKEDYFIADAIGSYQNRKFDKVVEWVNEVEKFIEETKLEVDDKGNHTNSLWCHSTLLRIRKIRAKRDPNLTFRRVSDKASLSLREELYCDITLLINMYYTLRTFAHSLLGHQVFKSKEDDLQQINEVDQFLLKIKLQLEEKIPETNSDWYHNKIAETRTLFHKLQPAEYSLQSQDVGSSSMELLSLHEELLREIKFLANIQCVDLLVLNVISEDQNLHLRDKYLKEVQVLMDEVDKFLLEIKLQLEEKIPGKNSDWYRNKIAESRTLTVKRYSAFPIRPQDVGYTNEQFQIFLSFRGEDTRFSFTRNLYNALHQEGFKVFMDDEGLQSGDSISQVLMGEIENSQLSIIVLSENFADSTWCLDEIVKILECKQKKNQLVWPIFYKVEPSDVRHQRNSYENAMVKQETRFGKDSENVKKWRSSLSKVCDLKAFHYKENSRYEGDFIQDIIKGAKNIRDHM